MRNTLVSLVVGVLVGGLGTATYDNVTDYRQATACPEGTVATYSLDRGDMSRCVTPAWAVREQTTEPYGGWDEAAQPALND